MPNDDHIARWTSRAIPKSPDIARAIDAPLGVVVRPLFSVDDDDVDVDASSSTTGAQNEPSSRARVKSAEHIARCQTCFGYISSACVLDARGFVCAMCGGRTSWTACATRGARYRDATLGDIQNYPEVRAQTYSFDIAREVISASTASTTRAASTEEALAPDDWRRRADAEAGRGRRCRSDGRAIVIIVDLNDANEEYCELMRTTITGCVEALTGEDVRFGVFAFRGDALEALNFDDDDDDDATTTTTTQGGVLRLRYFGTHANPKKHGFIRRVRDAVTTSLEDVFPSALTRRAAIEDAVENGLRSRVDARNADADVDGGRAGGGTAATASSGGRIFGPVLDEVLGAIEDAFDEGLMSSARVLTFLRGAPDAGVGACDVVARARGGASSSASSFDLDLDAAPPTALDFELASSEAEALMIPAHDHYELVGERCALSGVEVDVIVVSDAFCDVSTVAPLAERSGGRVMMYEDRADIPIVGDVFRLLTRSRGVNCTLRVRCSPGLEVSRAYGALVADNTYPGLYHIASCTPDDAFAFDFNFTAATTSSASDGGRRSHGAARGTPPTIQMAFEYTTTTRHADGVVTRRRCRRIHTSRAMIARNVREVYKTLDVECVAALIAQHALANADEFGLVDARARAIDWLVAFVSKAHVFAHGDGRDDDVDVDFSLLPHLAPTTRLIYGLLRSKMLFPFASGSGPDARCVARSRALRLSADDVADHLYPTLTEYSFNICGSGGGTSASTSTTTVIRRLRRDALREDCVYVLDAPQDIVVYYGSASATSPPHSGGSSTDEDVVEAAVRAARSRRTFQPRVWRIRGGGVDDPAPLERYFVEDLDVEHSGRGRGFDGFIEDYVKARCRARDVEDDVASA